MEDILQHKMKAHMVTSVKMSYLVGALVFLLSYMEVIPECRGNSVHFKYGGPSHKVRLLLATGRGGRVRGGGGMTSIPPPPPQQVCDCRRRHGKVPFRDGRIFNGTHASRGEFPWQVRIEQFDRDRRGTWNHICGGTLISSYHVVTASHCLDRDVDKYQVVVGTHDRHNRGKTYRVKDYVQHRSSNLEYENDIALVTIEGQYGEGVACDQFVQPICLDGPEFKAGTHCFVSGWGKTETRVLSDRLLYAAVPLLSFEKCQEIFRFPASAPVEYHEPSSNYLRSIMTPPVNKFYSRFSDKMLCAGPVRGGADTCSGDSGGPLACFDRNNVAYLTGITSWAAHNCGVQPSAYTKVSKYKQWIKEEQDLSPSGGNLYTKRAYYR